MFETFALVLALAAPPDFGPLRVTLRKPIEDGTLAGTALVVLVDGRTVFREGFGDQTPDAPARIASDSKPFTAAGVALLAERGKLALSDTLSQRLPEFAGTPSGKATLRQLLSHTAGMPALYPGGRPEGGTLADFARTVAKARLTEAGTFRYGGVGIDVAGRVGEKAAGVPWADFLKAELFAPLGLKSTRFARSSEPTPEQRKAGEGPYVACGGGLIATPDDLAAFYEMLRNDGRHGDKVILKPETVREMTTPRPGAVNERQARPGEGGGLYGLGLYLARPDAQGIPRTFHHGGALGTMAWCDRDRKLVAVFVSQKNLRAAMPTIRAAQDELRRLFPAAVE